MRRTAEDAAKTRLALLEAALMSFEEKGWRGATFEHVSNRAGVTRGALHHHFQDKVALLTEALEWGWSDYGERLFDQSDETAAADEWLPRLLTGFVLLLSTDARFRALASVTVVVAPQALSDHANSTDALDAWRDRITNALDQTGSPLPASTVAGLVLVLLQGFTVTAVTRPHDLPQPDELGAAISALVRGLLT